MTTILEDALLYPQVNKLLLKDNTVTICCNRHLCCCHTCCRICYHHHWQPAFSCCPAPPAACHCSCHWEVTNATWQQVQDTLEKLPPVKSPLPNVPHVRAAPLQIPGEGAVGRAVLLPCDGVPARCIVGNVAATAAMATAMPSSRLRRNGPHAVLHIPTPTSRPTNPDPG